jgi:hypothetical protein
MVLNSIRLYTIYLALEKQVCGLKDWSQNGGRLQLEKRTLKCLDIITVVLEHNPESKVIVLRDSPRLTQRTKHKHSKIKIKNKTFMLRMKLKKKKTIQNKKGNKTYKTKE